MTVVPSSFRDPSGRLFWHEGKLYRTVTEQYIETYRAVRDSGLFEKLTADHRVVPFRERPAEEFPGLPGQAALILEPDLLPFISYPYEWSFGQLKDAALLTLDLHMAGLKKNFLLKDASAYNVQFCRGKPIFIDHLSFDRCDRYPVWPAYGQFCRHFLAPLVLMAKVDPGLNQLLKLHIDGIPLPLARKLVPTRRLLTFGLMIHFSSHARSQEKYADKGEIVKTVRTLSPRQMMNIALSLRETVSALDWQPAGTQWSEYYDGTNYSDQAMADKIRLMTDFIGAIPRPAMVWDFGGNTGVMSRAIRTSAGQIICFDLDPAAVETNYRLTKKNREDNILPLVMDFNNPSPGVGFASEERLSLGSRGRADLGMALALVHHMAISNNLPLAYLARYFASLCRYLIIEFVPREDSQVQRLLLSREDIFSQYTEDHFIEAFRDGFEICRREKIADSKRTLFLMKAN